MTDLEAFLLRVPTEDKAKAFDALVREFQGRGRFVGRRIIRVSRRQESPAEDRYAEIPMYEFTLRVDGRDDFAAAVLKLAKIDLV